MTLKRKMSKFLRMQRAEKRLSVAEFSEKLDISKATLQGYLSGEGNPTLDTVDHIAGRLGVDSISLLAGVCSEELREGMYFSKALCKLEAMTSEARQEFQELASRMLALWIAEGEK